MSQSNIEVEVDLSHLGVKNKKAIKLFESRAVSGLQEYFGHRCDSSNLQLIFKGSGVATGVNRETLVAHKPTHRTHGQGVPIGIWTEGTQAIFGTLSSPRMNTVLLEALLNSEPVQRELEQTKKPESDADKIPELVSDPHNSDAIESVQVDKGLSSSTSETDPEGSESLSDDEKLQLFFIALVESCFFDAEDGEIFVSNDAIFDVAKEHLDNVNERKTFGHFFRYKVAPFGTKGEVDNTQGWNLDVKKVLRFIEDGDFKKVKVSNNANTHPSNYGPPIQSEDQNQSGDVSDLITKSAEITKHVEAVELLMHEIRQLKEVADTKKARIESIDERIDQLLNVIRELQAEKEENEHDCDQLSEEISQKETELAQAGIPDKDALIDLRARLDILIETV